MWSTSETYANAGPKRHLKQDSKVQYRYESGRFVMIKITYPSYDYFKCCIICKSFKNNLRNMYRSFQAECAEHGCSIVTVYYSLFHSVMVHGFIFWGNSTHSLQIFKIQNKAIRTMMGRQNRESCRQLFKELKILPCKSQCVLSLALFIVNNKENFVINSDQHSIHTRNCNNCCVP
jgi:hypothetical protein